MLDLNLGVNNEFNAKVREAQTGVWRVAVYYIYCLQEVIRIFYLLYFGEV